MQGPLPIVHVARVVLEARTPLSVSTGSPDGVFDSALVRDANGLPALPGTSLAGVLRQLWGEQHGDAGTKVLFGHQEHKDGQPSRVGVSWGALLDSQGRSAEGLLLGAQAKRLEDPLFQAALAQVDAPVYRNRVRLSHKGAAADRGKFDRAVLPAGNRFAVELRLWAGADSDDSTWNGLLNLLAHPALRLGGATRAGLGGIACVSVHQGRFDLTRPEETKAFRALGRGLDDTAGLRAFDPQHDAAGWITGTLRLKARGLWRIGQGLPDPHAKIDKPADLLPVTEERVQWRGHHGERALRALLLPASSLKGALAHRMAFHANRFAGTWADSDTAHGEPAKPEAVKALLGEVKDTKAKGASGSAANGQAGCLFIDDAFVSIDAASIARLMHNAIDRFTGGVRDRVLFEEESLYGGAVEVPVSLHLGRLQHRGSLADSSRVLSAALDDLCQGRLGLGSRTTTGNGFFDGELSGPLRQWLEEHNEMHQGEIA